LGGRAFNLLIVGAITFTLLALVGIGYAWFTRSAGGAVVHYSWPIKWALTLAANSPDLPAGARFMTAGVSATPAPGRWVVRGQVELPNEDGPRLLTSYAATVSTSCPSLSQRQCWSLERLVLGSVPAATAPDPQISRVDPAISVPIALQAPPAPAPAPPAESDEALEEALGFILAERNVDPSEDLFAALGAQNPPVSPKRPRADPDLIRQIQRALTDLGYDPGPVDGLAGKRTTAAASAFRKDHGLKGSGLTHDLLEDLSGSLQRASSAAAPNPAPAEAGGSDEQNIEARHCQNVSRKHRDCDA
jgi:hypothetical protein